MTGHLLAASAAAANSPSWFWYATRGLGSATLIVLTGTVVLGIVTSTRWIGESTPAFVAADVHRNLSLLGMCLLAAHIITTVLDPFAHISVRDVLIPVGAAYRPVWLGLGVAAMWVLIGVVASSLLRERIGPRLWRLIHWAAYASWPLAVIHGLGTGSDAKATWMLALTAGCVAVVLVAVAARVSAGWPDHLGTRLSAAATAALVPVGLLVWLPSGPLAAGWAKRAGTPSSLLVANVSGAHATSAGGQSSTGGGSPTSFTTQASGTVAQAQIDEGQSEVHISLEIPGQQLTKLGVRIFGQPIEGGGISMSSSRVSLGTASDPERYRGEVTALNGTTIEATVSSGATRLRVLAQLQVDPAGGTAAGTVTVSPER